MKNIIKTAAAAFLTSQLLTGCYAFMPMEYGGLVYRDVTLPLTANNGTPGTKVGTATATSLLGLINTGNASIEAAKRAGGITRVTHVDYKVTNTLGLMATYTVYVYGE